MTKDVDELNRIRDDCRSMVTKRSLMSAGAAAVPAPGVDVAVDIGLLANLLPEISRKFGLSGEQVSALDPHLASQLMVIAASLGNNLIGRVISKQMIVLLLKKSRRQSCNQVRD